MIRVIARPFGQRTIGRPALCHFRSFAVSYRNNGSKSVDSSDDTIQPTKQSDVNANNPSKVSYSSTSKSVDSRDNSIQQTKQSNPQPNDQNEDANLDHPNTTIFGDPVDPSQQLDNDIRLMMDAGLDCQAAQLFIQRSEYATPAFCLRLIKKYGNDLTCVNDKPLNRDMTLPSQSLGSLPTMHDLSLPLLLHLYHANKLSLFDIEHMFHIATISGSINQSNQIYLMLAQTGIFGMDQSICQSGAQPMFTLPAKSCARLKLTAQMMNLQCWTVNRMKRETMYRPSMELIDRLLDCAPSSNLFDWVESFSLPTLTLNDHISGFRSNLGAQLENAGYDNQQLFCTDNQPIEVKLDWQAPVRYLKPVPHSPHCHNLIPDESQLDKPYWMFVWHPFLLHQHERAKRFHRVNNELPDGYPFDLLGNRAHDMLLNESFMQSLHEATQPAEDQLTDQSSWDSIPLIDSLIIASHMDLFDRSIMNKHLSFQAKSVYSLDLVLLHHLAFMCSLPVVNNSDVGNDILDAMQSIISRAIKHAVKTNTTHLNLMLQAGLSVLSIRQHINPSSDQLKSFEIYQRMISIFEEYLKPVEHVAESGKRTVWQTVPDGDTYRCLLEMTVLFDRSNHPVINQSINRTLTIQWMRELQVRRTSREDVVTASILTMSVPIKLLDSARTFIIAYLNRGDDVKQSENLIAESVIKNNHLVSLDHKPLSVNPTDEEWKDIVSRTQCNDVTACQQILDYHFQHWPCDHSIDQATPSPYLSYHPDCNHNGRPLLAQHRHADTWLLLFHCAAVKHDNDVAFDLWAQYLQSNPDPSHVICLGFMRAILLAHLRTALHSPPDTSRWGMGSLELMRYIHFVPSLYRTWLSSSSMRSMLCMTFLLSHASLTLSPRYQMHITGSAPGIIEERRNQWRGEARMLIEMQAKYDVGDEAQVQRETELLFKQIGSSDLVHRVIPSHFRLLSKHERRVFRNWGLYMDDALKAQQSAIAQTNYRAWTEVASQMRQEFESRQILLSDVAHDLLHLEHFPVAQPEHDKRNIWQKYSLVDG